MANNGIKGSMAGTALARAYKNLSTSKAQDKLRSLGIEAVDQAGNLRNVASILSELGQRVQDMGSAERLAIFEQLFGRGQAAALKLAAPGADFTDMQKTLQNADGTAARTAKTMDDTLGGSFRMLMSAVEGVQIAIGEALQGTLRKWMDGATRIAGKMTEWVMANKGLIVSAMKVIAVVGGAGAALVALGMGGAAMAAVFGGIATLISGAVAAVGLLASAFAALISPIGLVVAAVVGLGAYILTSTEVGASAISWLGEQFASLYKQAATVFGAIGDALAAGDITLAAKVLWLALKVQWTKGMNYLSRIWETLYVTVADVFDRMITSTATAFDLIYTSARNAMSGIYKLILGVGSFIAKTFWTAAQGVVDAFGYILDQIVTTGYALHLIDTDEMIALDRALKKMKEGAKGFTDDQKDKAESFYEGEMAHADRQMEQRNQALTERIIERERAAGDRRGERDEAYMTDLQASEAALQQAQQEWKDAAAEAARKRDTAAKGPEESDPPDMSDALAGLKDKLAQAGKATVDAVDRAVSVSGTFNASALLGLQTGSAADRTARATEETATNTRKLLDESKHGGLTFG